MASYKRLILNDSLVNETLKLGTSAGNDAQLWTNNQIRLNINGSGTTYLYGSLVLSGNRTITTQGGSHSLSINPHANLMLGSDSTDHIYIGNTGRNITMRGTTTFNASTSGISWNDLSNKPSIFMHDYATVTGNPTFAGTNTFSGPNTITGNTTFTNVNPIIYSTSAFNGTPKLILKTFADGSNNLYGGLMLKRDGTSGYNSQLEFQTSVYSNNLRTMMTLKSNGNLNVSGHVNATSRMSIDNTQFGSYNIGIWNEAYSWGNHASAGYSTFSGSYDDLTNKPSLDGNIVYNQNIQPLSIRQYWADSTPAGTQFNNAFSAPNSTSTRAVYFDGGSGKSSVSTWYGVANKPYAAIDVSQTYLSIWTNNTVGAWSRLLDVFGDHSLVRANVNFQSTGVITASGGDSTGWNQAYGWGDHSRVGYLTAHQSLANYTTKGSNISQFANNSGYLTSSGTINWARYNVVQDTRSTLTAPYGGGRMVRWDFKRNGTDGLNDGSAYHGVMQFNPWSDNSGGKSHQVGFTYNNNIYIRTNLNDTTWNSWSRLAHASEIPSLSGYATQSWVNSQGFLTSQTDSQTLSISGSELTISNGNKVTLPSYSNLTLSNVKSYIEGDDGVTHIRFDFQDYGPHWNTNDGHSTNQPMSIKLWDSYADQAQSGLDPYATILDIYGRSGHERDQLYFGNTGRMYHRNVFYGTNTWNSWKKIWDNSDLTDTVVDSLKTNYNRWLTSHQDLSNYATLNSSQTFTGGKNFSANSTFSSNLYVGGNLATDNIVSYRGTDTIDIDAYKVTVGGTGSQSNPNKLVLRGHAVPYSGGGHLAGEGFLQFDSNVNWTGGQRRWAITNAWGIGINNAYTGNLTFLVGTDSSQTPTIGMNGALGTASGQATAVGMRITSGGEIHAGAGGDSGQWNTAYGWGNHADAGYLTSESQTLAQVTSNGATSYENVQLLRNGDGLKVGGIRGYAIGSQTGEYIHMYERVHIGNPSGWGHRNATAPANGLGIYGGIDIGQNNSGYINLNNSRKDLNWDTAYSWGNHASGGYAPTASPTFSGQVKIEGSNRLIGGFGAVTTAGTKDWNHDTNAISGQGYTLLLGNATNGHGFDTDYYHPFNWEYNRNDGQGNMTQLAVPYSGSGAFAFRTRYSGTWTSWRRIVDTGIISVYADKTPSWVPSSDPGYLTSSSQISVTSDILIANKKFIRWGGASGQTRIYGDNNNNVMTFATNNTERARIDDSGLKSSTNVWSQGYYIRSRQLAVADDNATYIKGGSVSGLYIYGNPTTLSTVYTDVGTTNYLPNTFLGVSYFKRYSVWYDTDGTHCGYIGSGKDMAYGTNDDLCIRGIQDVKITANNGSADLASFNADSTIQFNTSQLDVISTSDAPRIKFVASASSGGNNCGSIYAHNGNEEIGFLDRSSSWAYKHKHGAFGHHQWRINNAQRMFLDNDEFYVYPGGTYMFGATTNGVYSQGTFYTNDVQVRSGNDLHLRGNSIIVHGSSPQHRYMDNNGVTRGYVFGNTNGFGLLDESGNWATKFVHNTSHNWYIGNSIKLSLDTTKLKSYLQIEASGGNSVNWTTAYGWGDHSKAGYTTGKSDIKLKTDVKTIDKPLEKLSKLRGVDFTWKNTNKKGGGVIAQEVEKILPDLVEYNVDVQAKTVDYNGLIGVLIESVKELKNEVETLKAKCNCKGEK